MRCRVSAIDHIRNMDFDIPACERGARDARVEPDVRARLVVLAVLDDARACRQPASTPRRRVLSVIGGACLWRSCTLRTRRPAGYWRVRPCADSVGGPGFAVILARRVCCDGRECPGQQSLAEGTLPQRMGRASVGGGRELVLRPRCSRTWSSGPTMGQRLAHHLNPEGGRRHRRRFGGARGNIQAVDCGRHCAEARGSGV